MSFEFKLRTDCELIFVMRARRNGAYADGLKIVLNDHKEKAPSLYSAGALLGLRSELSNPIHQEAEWNTCDVEVN